MTNRRSFLLGIAGALAAPVIVRAEVLMPYRPTSVLKPPVPSIISGLDLAVPANRAVGDLFIAYERQMHDAAMFGAGWIRLGGGVRNIEPEAIHLNL